jgi:cytochrome c oxidase cbb3-type subunit 3/ubiquinol-cytochrome c reductase cytochrome c subunit
MKTADLALALVSALALAAAACSPPGKPSDSDPVENPHTVRDFGLLYRQNCAGCHGVSGEGNTALGLANPVYLAIADNATIQRIIARGVRRTLMPAFASSAGGMLTDEQVAVLASGLRAKWGKPNETDRMSPPPYAALDAGSAVRGRAAYEEYCARCHGPGGRGTALGSSIVDPSFLALVSDQNLRTTIIAGRPDLGHPDWRGDVSGRAMTDREVTDVVGWLAAQRKSSPGQPYPSDETANP